MRTPGNTPTNPFLSLSGLYQANPFSLILLKDKSEAAAVSLAFIWTADGSN
jgi:hypothetical protein